MALTLVVSRTFYDIEVDAETGMLEEDCRRVRSYSDSAVGHLECKWDDDKLVDSECTTCASSQAGDSVSSSDVEDAGDACQQTMDRWSDVESGHVSALPTVPAVAPGCWIPQDCWSAWPVQSDPVQMPLKTATKNGDKKHRKQNLTGTQAGKKQETNSTPKKVSLPSADGETRTTLKLSNLPSSVTTTSLTKMLDAQGLKGLYSFAFVDFDFISGHAKYAVVDLQTPEVAVLAKQLLHGFTSWDLPAGSAKKTLIVGWNGADQGVESLMKTYRNQQVMHSSVPIEYKPALFSNGVRQSILATQAISAPLVLPPFKCLA